MIILYANNLLNPYPDYPGSISPDDTSSYKTEATRHPTPSIQSDPPPPLPVFSLMLPLYLQPFLRRRYILSRFIPSAWLCMHRSPFLISPPPLYIQLLLFYWLISPLSINMPQFLPILAWIFMHPPQAGVFSPTSFASACLVNHHCTLNPYQ